MSCDLTQGTSASGVFPVPCPPEIPVHPSRPHPCGNWMSPTCTNTKLTAFSTKKYYTSNKARWRCSHLHCWQTRQVAYSSKGRVDAGLDFTRKQRCYSLISQIFPFFKANLPSTRPISRPASLPPNLLLES